jgi:cold shock CspA family protein
LSEPAVDALAPDRVHRGVVAGFDVEVGLGTVRDDRGPVLAFHATAIADGSRRIDVGTAVAFLVVHGRGGTLEARSLVPLAPAG